MTLCQPPCDQRAPGPLVAPIKTQRGFNFHSMTLQARKKLVQAAGLKHPSDITAHHSVRRSTGQKVESVAPSMWPPERTCTNMAGLKMLFQGHSSVSAKYAHSPGFTGHQRPSSPGVEDCRRPEENDFIDSFRRKLNIRTIEFFMHFHTGQKHAVSARRSQSILAQMPDGLLLQKKQSALALIYRHSWPQASADSFLLQVL